MSSSSQNPRPDSPTSARKVVADLLWLSVPSADNADAKARAGEMLNAFRAEVLNEAADAIDAGKQPFPEVVRNGASWAARMVRRMADPDVPAAEMQRADGTPIGGA